MRSCRKWISFHRVRRTLGRTMTITRLALLGIREVLSAPIHFDGLLVRWVARMTSLISKKPSEEIVIESYSARMYREDGGSARSIHLSVHADGSVRLEAYDSGSSVEEVWGDSDYEFWVTVPATALRKLAFALLREKYVGRDRAVDELAAFCKREDIEYEWDSYA